MELKQLTDVLTQAEQMVQGIKDPELRRAAFERILDHLLASSEPTLEGKPKPKLTASSTASQPTLRRSRSGRGPTGALQQLVAEGFFKKPRTAPDILSELDARGRHYRYSDLTRPLERFARSQVLRRQKSVPAGGNTAVLHYSDW